MNMHIRIIGGPYSSDAEGKVYPVAAIRFGEAGAKALIDVEWFPTAPFGVQENNFELVDDRISRYWRYGPQVPATLMVNARPTILTFAEWVSDIFFFEKLVTGDYEARSIWDIRRAQLAIEFAHPDIRHSAIHLGNGWIQCHSCAHAWYQIGLDEMAICESCHVMQLVGFGQPATFEPV